MSGKLIVLDGPDGCGKSTQVRMLCQWLLDQGTDAIALRDPGDTEIGERIRKILLSRNSRDMDTMTELLLYMACRAQLWSQRIKPALEAGRWVVMDRWVSSTCAYQGHAGGYGIDRVLAIAENALERIWPDLTVILDVGVEVAAGRMGDDLDRIEQRGEDYHQKVQEGFLRLAETNSGFVVVDARAGVEAVHEHVVREIDVLC
ncbi:MAG: dTMP kinase [Planctomycetes bacterium]|nr:dTMP kinase [Planctomycetota bacterium]